MTITNPTPAQILSAWPKALERLNDDQAAALALIIEALEEPANGWRWSADGLDCDNGAAPHLEAWPEDDCDPDAIITVTVDDDAMVRLWGGYGYPCNDSHAVSPAHVGAINALDAAWRKFFPADADPIDHADGDL